MPCCCLIIPRPTGQSCFPLPSACMKQTKAPFSYISTWFPSCKSSGAKENETVGFWGLLTSPIRTDYGKGAKSPAPSPMPHWPLCSGYERARLRTGCMYLEKGSKQPTAGRPGNRKDAHRAWKRGPFIPRQKQDGPYTGSGLQLCIVNFICKVSSLVLWGLTSWDTCLWPPLSPCLSHTKPCSYAHTVWTISEC